MLDSQIDVLDQNEVRAGSEAGALCKDVAAAAVVAEVEEGAKWRVVGSALAAPLEEVADVVGPDEDPMLGRDNTVYSIAVTVDEGARSLIEAVRELMRAIGQPMSGAELGIDRDAYVAAIPGMIESGENDAAASSPRVPTPEEFADLFLYAYEGRPVDF